jgi:nicotinamide phosphoribosyltransferase
MNTIETKMNTIAASVRHGFESIQDQIQSLRGALTSDYNVALDTDSYKPSHFLQYPPNTEYVFSYVEARGSSDKPSSKIMKSLENYLTPEMLKLFKAENTTQPFNFTLMFGLQYINKMYLSKRVTKEMVDYAAKEWKAHGEPFNYDGWMYIVNELEGKLPVRIRAAKEGAIIPLKNALITVENTDPKCFWLTSYIEPAILRVWYGITVGTLSWTIKQIIAAYLRKSSDTMDGLLFKLHDFGSRGVSSYESAGIGGAAHLVNFMGSDTMRAIQVLKEIYNVGEDEMPAYSIPAGEHSSFTSWRKEFEKEAYRNMIVQFGKPGALFAAVSDSYDIFNAVDNIWGKELKDELIASGATAVIRPDSGEPKDIVLKVVQLLDKNFGSTINSKGYKVLHPSVRVIQGDGINLDSVSEIYDTLLAAGYSADNVALGMGGGLLQMVNRDTLQFAMKCSAAKVAGEWVDVYKDPITDSGKRSKRGRVGLFQNTVTSEYATIRLDEVTELNGEFEHKGEIYIDAMDTVFENGEVLVDEKLDVIRARSNDHYFIVSR